MLLLLQFLFDHSEIYTGETRHIVPPYNKAGISNFCLEFQKLQKYCSNARFLENATPPSVSYSIILKFYTGETRHIVPPYNKAGISNFCSEFQKIAEIRDFFKTLLLLEFLFGHSEFFTGETRHIVPAYNKARISNFLLRIPENCRNSRFLQNATSP